MGIIKKQSISGTIYLYIGVLLGFITTGIVFPKVLTTDEVGLLRLLVSVAVMVSQFAGLGFTSPTIRLFPYFRNKEKGHNGFLTLSLIVSLGGYALFLTALILLKPWVVEQYQEKSALFVTYFYYLIPLIFFKLFFNALDNYYKVLYNAVKGVILKDIWQRIFILVCVIAYYFRLIDFNLLVVFYVISICLPTLLMAVSLIIEGEFHLGWSRGFITKDLAKTIINMSLFGILNGFSGIMILNVDILMINHILGLGNTGIYAVTMYFGTLVNMPVRSITNIASVVIADAWKENNIRLIADIYRKSSIVLTTLGLLILIGLWANIGNVFRIIGTDYETGRYVILFIGLANLFGMAASVSKNILGNSVYYRYSTYFILTLFVLIIGTNLYFIPRFGIVGAAFASALSKLIYNLLVWLFLRIKFGLQPFNYKFILVLLIALVSYSVSLLLPPLTLIADIIIRSSIILVIFLPLIYIFKISEDINETINSVLMKVSGR